MPLPWQLDWCASSSRHLPWYAYLRVRHHVCPGRAFPSELLVHLMPTVRSALMSHYCTRLQIYRSWNGQVTANRSVALLFNSNISPLHISLGRLLGFVQPASLHICMLYVHCQLARYSFTQCCYYYTEMPQSHQVGTGWGVWMVLVPREL
jgi:hypothetical protein